MQDSSNNKLDPSFVEASWKDMSQMLDTAMPVAQTNRSNRSLLLLLSTLLILSCLLSAYFGFKYHALIPTAALTKETKIVQKVYIKEAVKSPHTTSISNGYTLTQPSVLNPNAPILSTSTILTDGQPNKSDTYYGGTKSNNIVSNTTQDKLGNQENMGQLIEVEHHINTIDPVSFMPTLAMELNAESSTNTLYSNEFITPVEEKRGLKFNFGVMVLASTDSDYTGLGLSSGVIVPLGSKLGFQTGLAINYLDRENYFINTFDRSPDPELVLKSNGEKYYIGLRNIKQVYVPLSLNYNLSTSLAVNSGVNLRYTYSETIDQTLPIPSAQPTRKPIQNHESIFTNANIGLSAGVQYRFNSKLSLLLDSEWGMSSLINKAQFSNPSQLNYDLNIINLTTNFTF